MSSEQLRRRLEQPGIIVAPGPHDMLTLLLANRIGFEAIYASGYWVMASQLGVPDAGIAGFRDFETAFRRIAEASDAPVIADADTGFGGTVNLDYTVRGYARLGIAAIQIEDQVFPKKCGHIGARPVVSTKAMCARIQTALAARGDTGPLIIARTDARGSEGFESASLRMQAYDEAGADILMLEAPRSEAEMREFCSTFDKPTLVNAAHGGRTPILAPTRYEEIGYKVAIYPGGAAMSAMAAVNGFLQNLSQGDANPECSGMMDFEEVSKMLGFGEIDRLEREFGLGE
jgi:2-methylisocitrate lyase-like PEP mutase family enzyme